MKMKYQKPMVAVEHYKLSQSIAACVIHIGLTNNSCVLHDKDTPVEVKSFAYTYANYFGVTCDDNCATVQDNEKICYHTSVNALFTS